MQQPLPQQHDQMGAQQSLAQQMVLCPVRLVYETQILVQPGDQIQPNQTFFINPQNPPPWMQNSLQTRQTIPNQVVYVHHMPNNIVSSVQQPMDQNQLFLQQNYGNFQIQQPMLTQGPQEMRPAMQIANIMPNMMQNVQPSVASERPVQTGQIQANPQIMQNQIVNRPVQNQVPSQVQVEVQRPVYMRPQLHQQPNTQRPIMTINQMQNVPQQPLASMSNVVHSVGQTFSPNVGRPIRTAIANNINTQPVPKIREITPSNVERPTFAPNANMTSNVRNFVPNYYRPIQPRPQMPHNVVSMPKMQQHIPVQTIQNTPVYNHDKNTSQQNTSTTQQQNNFTIIQHLNNPSVNRKRKSESPDEIQKKMVANPALKDNYNTPSISKAVYNQPMVQPSLTVTKLVHEIGTNTSPVHRPKINPQFQMNSPLVVKNNDITEHNNINKETVSLQDKDKMLVRNTVYTQARGRVLQDKIDEIKPESAVVIEPIKVVEITNKVTPETELQIAIEAKLRTTEIPMAIPEVKKVQEVAPSVAESSKNDNQTPKSSAETATQVSIPKTVAETITQNTVKPKTEKDTVATMNEEVNVTNKSNHTQEESNSIKKMDVENVEKPVEYEKRPIKQENINILTHVVDGYVIQESNFAFPIRKPLKEKTLHTNLKSKESEKKDLLRESIKEELKSTAVDIPLLPFHYLLLDSAREEKLKAELEEQKMEEETNDPFNQLQTTTVKTWTVDDLSSHLLKFNWKDTVSLLQEHEIDGESLYLVSKQQLLTIGVTEEHADVICKFVKS